MKTWFIAILLALLCASAHAGQLRLPSAFDGKTVSQDMVKAIPGENGAALLALKMAVLPESPMDGFRPDMWSSGQIVMKYHLHLLFEKCTDGSVVVRGNKCKDGGSSTALSETEKISILKKLTPEQQYKFLFCLINRQEMGFTCQDTSEIMSASRAKPWWIPVVVLPQTEVGRFTAMITSRPIPSTVTRGAGNNLPPQSMTGVPGRIVVDRSLIPEMAPRRLEVYVGPVPEYLRRDLQVHAEAKPKTSPPAKKVANTASGPVRAKKPGPGGPTTKDRTP